MAVEGLWHDAYTCIRQGYVRDEGGLEDEQLLDLTTMERFWERLSNLVGRRSTAVATVTTTFEKHFGSVA